MGIGNANKVLIVKSEGKRPLGAVDAGVAGNLDCGLDRTVQGTAHVRAFVKTVMNLLVP